MPSDRALVDTNVVVYAHFEDSEHYAACSALLARAQAGQVDLCITSQNLAEFFAIVTNPRRVTNPLEPEEALDAITALRTIPGLTLLLNPADLPDRWMTLARQYRARGANVFDLQLVATMEAHGVSQIYTLNASHFNKISGLTVLTP